MKELIPVKNHLFAVFVTTDLLQLPILESMKEYIVAKNHLFAQFAKRSLVEVQI